MSVLENRRLTITKFEMINKIVKISIITTISSALFVGVVSAKPSENEIKLLEPQETYYAMPQEKSIGDVENRMNDVLAQQDVVDVFPNLQFGLGGVVKVWRAPSYKVVDETKNIEIRSWGLTIDEVLDDGGVEVGEQDVVEPGKDTTISQVQEIKITRVKETEQKEIEIIDFDIIEKNDPTLERGKTEVKQKGENGERELVYLIRRENGVEVSRSLISNTITKQPQDKIILNGTKIVVLSSESGESSWTWGVTASRKYSKGTLIRVTNLSNGKSVETRVGGYGPMTYTGRILDLNIDAWEQISSGGAGSGTMQVKVEELSE